MWLFVSGFYPVPPEGIWGVWPGLRGDPRLARGQPWARPILHTLPHLSPWYVQEVAWLSFNILASFFNWIIYFSRRLEPVLRFENGLPLWRGFWVFPGDLWYRGLGISVRVRNWGDWHGSQGLVQADQCGRPGWTGWPVQDWFWDVPVFTQNVLWDCQKLDCARYIFYLSFNSLFSDPASVLRFDQIKTDLTIEDVRSRIVNKLE